MSSLTRNLTTLGAVVLLILGTGFTGIGIFKAEESGTKNLGDEYIIPSQVLNSLTVVFLLYLTSSNTTFSPSYKLLIILLLVGGLVIDIYLTGYSDREPESIAAYSFLVLNFLIRTFFLIDLSQSEWTAPIIQQVAPIQKVIKDSVVRPVQNIVKDAYAPKYESPSEDSGRELTSKWDKLKNIIRSRPEGLDQDSEKDAWKNVIRPAKDEGRKDIMAILKEAVSTLKDRDGNSIPLNSVDAVGGKRRA